ncbi:MAG TPA: hypothetical protein DCY64_05810 [Hydrogenophaga sp.]|uniref:glycosyltransferase family 2 protein n=1 Tax=Hydrogenophaga sp. TaxID=1904254 RepID=UPI0008CC869F|nr:glycosyltransferase family 2 protein [Hydrogenophaga sp.]OGA76571.1 MAG: hypothetical protein A2X73_19920 [Burkholderiales bacterium GWE1_65_30]OGA91487.1 MAG: hypothetical protein A2X72_04825 [Burkholderiales bacterium GWF1_66_17]HAX19782.1 hypothetical protein [Hydrogenophaga sp.]HBU20160.1 hypothetical protein [Hydrogenophaga sp.]
MNSPDKALLGIAAIMKNEGPYLVEWLAHHRCLGVQNFFIAANDNDDDNLRLFKALEEQGYLRLLLTPTREGVKPQIPAYAAVLDRFGSEVQWMAFIDADEFIWPTSDLQDLPSMVARFHAQTQVGAIALNWATYGSSRQVHFEDQPVIQRFERRANDGFEVNHHIKSIVRTKAVARYRNPHYAVLHAGYQYLHTDGTAYRRKPSYFEKTPTALGLSETICWQDFRINHYVIKSWTEYVDRKIRRGRAVSPNAGLNHDFFFFHDRNEVHDPVPAAHLQRVQAEIDTILSALRPRGIDPAFFARMIGPQNQPVAPGIVNGAVESIALSGTQLSISGWGLAWRDQALERCELKINGSLLASRLLTGIPRADVQRHFPRGPLHSGFVLQMDRAQLPPTMETLELVAWVPGKADVQPLPLAADIDGAALQNILDAPPSMPGHIDHVLWGEEGLEIEGWGLLESNQCFADFEVEINGDPLAVLLLERTPRPDVQRVHAQAPIGLGFRLGCKLTKLPASHLEITLYGITSRQQRFWLARHTIEQMRNGDC